MTRTAAEHPHEFQGVLPKNVSSRRLKEISRINTGRAVFSLVFEWAVILAAIFVCESFWHPALYALAVVLIGARQHALAVVGHDGVHYRLFRNKRWNDWISDILVYWPLFLTLEGFRWVHSAHHRYLGTDRDIQAPAFGMTDRDGSLNPSWRFPKTSSALLATLLFKMWPRDVLAGIRSLLQVRYYPWRYTLARLLFVTAWATLLVAVGWGEELLLYWVVPRLTWFAIANDIRLICQHSALRGPIEPYGNTRTTIPSLLDRIFLLPCNITYHIEHHWFPGVPCHNLPRLHALLMDDPEYRENAHITRGFGGVWRELTDPRPVDFDQIPRPSTGPTPGPRTTS